MRQSPAALAGHAVWGAVLLCWPGTVLEMLGGQPAGRPETWILRVLGARHLAQAAVCAALPAPAVLKAGAAADTLHAASCAGLALAEPRWRRVGMLGGLGAATFAAVDLAAARQARQDPDWTRD